ncbi:unnamed protein product [Vitrella brassicaformis CCMP3155]|uniref:Apple domain-containing protein n=2 Tax=Vitrella brassicaformis TaxID=1169539 RepID=A0A0G4GP50_VITBC|nr:unnamed protein product [Vitrella brassicaformis CCMP3155]|mmetsp:Transcript_34259/g.84848  ORF Transcript_34259/g.84848 Transcript_34259/m.84848 type:complete len:341 (+) Transcript_34259:82-1104(+)|eukprot:CEM32086.1 unnamed protein product [Vitrella brassicaformis CCMP3155]
MLLYVAICFLLALAALLHSAAAQGECETHRVCHWSAADKKCRIGDSMFLHLFGGGAAEQESEGEDTKELLEVSREMAIKCEATETEDACTGLCRWDPDSKECLLWEEIVIAALSHDAMKSEGCGPLGEVQKRKWKCRVLEGDACDKNPDCIWGYPNPSKPQEGQCGFNDPLLQAEQEGMMSVQPPIDFSKCQRHLDPDTCDGAEGCVWYQDSLSVGCDVTVEEFWSMQFPDEKCEYRRYLDAIKCTELWDADSCAEHKDIGCVWRPSDGMCEITALTLLKTVIDDHDAPAGAESEGGDYRKELVAKGEKIEKICGEKEDMEACENTCSEDVDVGEVGGSR